MISLKKIILCVLLIAIWYYLLSSYFKSFKTFQIDAKKVKANKWEIFTHGGRNATGIDAITYARIAEKNGAGEILLTSMDNDGTKSGYDLELTKAISSCVSIPVIASGGVGTLEHLYEGFNQGLASAVLAASIFHFGEYTIKEAKEYLIKKNIPMRL